MGSRRIWLLSAYRADSHAAWADWLVSAHPWIDWRRLELPGRHFSWRIRGNPLSWLNALPPEQPERIIATSMVDLATLKGLQPRLAAVPADYYFHENQFAYPVSTRQVTSLEPQMVQLYGALAADRVLFNSAFNRDSFLQGVEALMARLPDFTPADLGSRLAAKSRVLPVPVTAVPAAAQRDPSLILWNHRWEYDKAPELFAEAMLALAGRGISFRLALLGPRGPRPPQALKRLREALGERIVADGRLDDAGYREVVGRAGIVVSTTRHEFQGLAIMEAASAGAVPLVPDALCYREQYPPEYRYPPGDVAAMTERLASWLSRGLPPAVGVSAWTGQGLLREWAHIIGK